MESPDRYSASLTEDGRYRLLVEAVIDYAIYMLDPNGTITSWNPGAQRLKGYTTDEIIGQHFSRFYSAEDRKDGLPARALETARREGKFESEGWHIRKDGTRFWAYVVIDPIHSPDGTVVGYAKITRDLTERRNSQLLLDQTREALTHSQKMEAIGQLTGGIAHDFNNLLMAVMGSLELMRKRLPDDPKLHTFLENALQGARRGATLTQRMLAFARRQDLVQEAIDIPALVRGMTDLLQRSLGPTINIQTQFPLVMAPAFADFNQLEMALLNLAMNARDEMPKGGEVIISAREETITENNRLRLPPADYVCLSVQDAGTGMDAETLRRASEPFFTTKGAGKGTGLGLPMVHGLTEQCGGRFVLQSAVGKGTTAEVWLPVAKPKLPGVEKALQIMQTRTDQESLVVLAVDDDALVLTNTVAMLEDLGHIGVAAASATEALEILRTRDGIDLVITDQAMPQTTGLELIQSIKAQWPQLPVILATGFAELDRGAGVGVPKLAKPFTQADLAREILDATGNPARQDQSSIIQFRQGAAS
ncbi:PAS domain S-box protein [Afipia carboxidovorans]|uniref:PAS domain-containing sensor histidine kinase n=1 Tax=Afipia carboxidovorans TaxID=40137 RepID=UPI003086405A|nr:PAS domain-containing sensor histidine kinase [Afipia carboxidovorans]